MKRSSFILPLLFLGPAVSSANVKAQATTKVFFTVEVIDELIILER